MQASLPQDKLSHIRASLLLYWASADQRTYLLPHLAQKKFVSGQMSADHFLFYIAAWTSTVDVVVMIYKRNVTKLSNFKVGLFNVLCPPLQDCQGLNWFMIPEIQWSSSQYTVVKNNNTTYYDQRIKAQFGPLFNQDYQKCLWCVQNLSVI